MDKTLLPEPHETNLEAALRLLKPYALSCPYKDYWAFVEQAVKHNQMLLEDLRSAERTNKRLRKCLRFALEFMETQPEDAMGMQDMGEYEYPIRDAWMSDAQAALNGEPK